MVDFSDITDDSLFDSDIFEDVKTDRTADIYQTQKDNYLDEYFMEYE